MQRHRHQEFIRILNAIEREVPAGKLIHLILDNYAAHKHPKVIEWLGRHPSFTFHFTPTPASWLNAVEGVLAMLTNQRLKRRVFPSSYRFRWPSTDTSSKQTLTNAFPLDQGPGQNHRCRPTEAPSVSFLPLVSDRLCKKALITRKNSIIKWWKP